MEAEKKVINTDNAFTDTKVQQVQVNEQYLNTQIYEMDLHVGGEKKKDSINILEEREKKGKQEAKYFGKLYAAQAAKRTAEELSGEKENENAALSELVVTEYAMLEQVLPELTGKAMPNPLQLFYPDNIDQDYPEDYRESPSPNAEEVQNQSVIGSSEVIVSNRERGNAEIETVSEALDMDNITLPSGIINTNKTNLESATDASEFKPESVINVSKTNPESVINANESKPESVINVSETKPESIINASELNSESVINVSETNLESIINANEFKPESVINVSKTNPESIINASEFNPESVINRNEMLLRQLKVDCQQESIPELSGIE